MDGGKSETSPMAGPATKVVCGHGPVGSQNDILSFEQMLTGVRSTVAKLKKSGASAQEVIARKPTPPLTSSGVAVSFLPTFSPGSSIVG